MSFEYELVAIPRGNASIICGVSYHVKDLPSVIICDDVAKDPSDCLSPLTSAKSCFSESRYSARYFPANIPWPMTKSSLTARSYNLCVNHRRRILHSTPGGPARWNDQTMVRFDRFITQIRSDGLNLQENTFELLARGKGGEVIAVKYKGVYVIVDNGYLNWSCTVPPFTVTSNMDEIQWSRWLESMRKDVECTFGILKKKMAHFTLRTALSRHQKV